jgi:hypothetical protein
MSSEETAFVPDDDADDEEEPNEEYDDVTMPGTGIPEGGGGESGGGDAFCRFLDFRWCCHVWLLLLLPLQLSFSSSSMAAGAVGGGWQDGDVQKEGPRFRRLSLKM